MTCYLLSYLMLLTLVRLMLGIYACLLCVMSLILRLKIVLLLPLLPVMKIYSLFYWKIFIVKLKLVHFLTRWGFPMNNDELDMKMDTRGLRLPWKGWSWYDCYLQAPDGTRFSPDMVRASLFAFQLAHELTGSPLQIYSLRNELKKRIASFSSLQELVPEVVIRWNGQETIVRLPSRTA